MYSLTIYCDDGNGKYVHSKSGTYAATPLWQLMPTILNWIENGTDNIVSFEVTKSEG